MESQFLDPGTTQGTLLGHPALDILMQLSVTMTIKKGGDFTMLPPEAGSLSSQWRKEGDSRGQGRRKGEWVLFVVPQGTGRKGKMRQKA